jgi:phage tail sheath protein FI
LRDHVSVIGPSARGVIVLSDVTTDDDFVYRAASVNRLVVALLRAARVMGDAAVFENSGEVLWTRLREGLENLLSGLWAEGALLGGSAREAFEVRCDRSTMTQADIDAGRLIARIIFTAAQPIVRITVVLAMDDAGQVTLAPSVSTANPQAA